MFSRSKERFRGIKIIEISAKFRLQSVCSIAKVGHFDLREF